MKAIGLIILSLFITVLNFLINSLIFWGIGNLIIYVFKISYVWTFAHGAVCALVFKIIK